MTASEDEILRMKAKLEKELGPDFDSMPADKLLRIAASNSFHNGKKLRQIELMLLATAAALGVILYKLFGFL